MSTVTSIRLLTVVALLLHGSAAWGQAISNVNTVNVLR